MNPCRCLVAALALIAGHSAHAQSVSTEVGPATVWFALLVVVFALLVSVGLFMARDREQDDAADAEVAPLPPPARSRGHRALVQRHAHARRKQQQEEFS